jgi:hypothetical protein
MARLPWYLKQIGKIGLNKETRQPEIKIKITKLGKIYLLAKVILGNNMWKLNLKEN